MWDDRKVLVYFEDEEHIVRRLGAAAVSCWSELPSDVRRTLFERSMQVFDETETEQLDDKLGKFLKEHETPDSEH